MVSTTWMFRRSPKSKPIKLIGWGVCFHFSLSPTSALVHFGPSSGGGLGEHTVSPARPCMYSWEQASLFTLKIVLSRLEVWEVHEEHTCMKDSQCYWVRRRGHDDMESPPPWDTCGSLGKTSQRAEHFTRWDKHGGQPQGEVHTHPGEGGRTL